MKAVAQPEPASITRTCATNELESVRFDLESRGFKIMAEEPIQNGWRIEARPCHCEICESTRRERARPKQPELTPATKAKAFFDRLRAEVGKA